jgi:hypothetical protein
MAEIEEKDGRLTITFRGEGPVPDEDCAALVGRIARDAPRRVQLVCDFASPGGTWTRALVGHSLPSLRAFIFDTFFQTLTRQRENSIGDLAAVLAASPELERVFAAGALELTPCTHASLRQLHALGDPISESFLHALAKCELPQLERLVLQLSSDAEPGRMDAVTLLSLSAPRLREIYVGGLGDVTSALEALAKKGIPKGWKELALVGDLDEDELLETLEKHRSAFGSLDVLALPLEDLMSTDGQETAKGLAKCVQDSEGLSEKTLPAIYADW